MWVRPTVPPGLGPQPMYTHAIHAWMRKLRGSRTADRRGDEDEPQESDAEVGGQRVILAVRCEMAGVRRRGWPTSRGRQRGTVGRACDHSVRTATPVEPAVPPAGFPSQIPRIATLVRPTVSPV